jgi:DNA polymerase III alpha subunit (gram-positive type)
MSKLRDQNYIAIDLELNKDDETDKITKIIQVGIAIGSPFRPKEIQTWSWYVNPEEKISTFITQLTGINDEMVTLQSTPLHQIADEISSLIKKHDVFINPVQWGFGDAEELVKTFESNGIAFPHFGRRVIDVKTIYVFLEMASGRSPAGGLSSSMKKYKIHFQGKTHRADSDAPNTLRFFFHLLERQGSLDAAMTTMKGIQY